MVGFLKIILWYATLFLTTSQFHYFLCNLHLYINTYPINVGCFFIAGACHWSESSSPMRQVGWPIIFLSLFFFDRKAFKTISKTETQEEQF